MRVRHDFRAYDSRGNLKLATFTLAPSTFEMERDVYQTRLNRRDFMYVEIVSSDPHEKTVKLFPQKV